MAYRNGYPGYLATVISDAARSSGACTDLRTFLDKSATAAEWTLIPRSTNAWVEDSALICEGRKANTVGGTSLFKVYDLYAVGPGPEACTALGM